jgi:putative transposase
MMIQKNSLNAEDVRQMSETILREQLGMEVHGYKCTTAMVCNVLLKAAVEGISVESVCTDMDRQAVTGSNTIREHLNKLLRVEDLAQQEKAMNAALMSCIPTELPRQGREMALDYHDEPFYGKTVPLVHYACRGQAKEGTTHFYRLASLYVMWRQVRVTLALTYVLPQEETIKVVQRLVERMQQLGFRPGVLYLDKGFCSGPVIRYLQQQHVPAVIACPLRGQAEGKAEGKGGTRALCRGRKAYCTDYIFTDGVQVRLALYPSRVPDRTGKRRLKWLAFVLIHLDFSASKVYQRYRRRFGIESSYRQMGRVRVHTTSRNPAFRFFLLGLALLLLNIWVRLRWLATRLPAVGPARLDLDLFRLHRFIVFLRRAIEQAFGVVDAIPIYSW